MDKHKRDWVVFLREQHRQLCFENGDHQDEVSTAYSEGADAIERLHALEPASVSVQEAWRPIETAPKDGTRIDLYGERCGRYPNAIWDWVGDGMGWTDAWHHGPLEEAEPFTHWMPLPNPPALAGDEGER